MLRRRSSLVVVDLPLPVTAQDSSSSSYAVEGGSATEDVTAGHTVQPKESEMPSEAEKKVLPTFQEPSPNALLDAFGF